MIETQTRGTKLPLRRRVGRCGAASRNDEFAKWVDDLLGANAEHENSVERAFRNSDPQVKTSVCLEAGALERMMDIVCNARLRAHPRDLGDRSGHRVRIVTGPDSGRQSESAKFPQSRIYDALILLRPANEDQLMRAY